MSKTKASVIAGFVYLGVVIAGYSLITGENPLESGGHPNDHGEHEIEEINQQG